MAAPGATNSVGSIDLCAKNNIYEIFFDAFFKRRRTMLGTSIDILNRSLHKSAKFLLLKVPDNNVGITS